MKPIRILVADDHSVVRRGIREILDCRREFKVCGEAANGTMAILKAKKLKPDVVVMDISMPEIDGLEATRQIRAGLPETQVLVLTMYESEQVMREVLNAGARGYVLKSDIDRNLILGIDALVRGRTYFSPRVSDIMITDYLKSGKNSPPISRSSVSVLTGREKQVLCLVAHGKANKEVAGALNISVKTAETHRSNLMRKVEVHSLGELIRFAIREKIIEL